MTDEIGRLKSNREKESQKETMFHGGFVLHLGYTYFAQFSP
jgi:hypothetical protein